MKKITTLEKLEQLALARRSVRFENSITRPLPATVVLCMTGRTIIGFMRRGMFLYEKPTPKGTKK